MASKDRDLSGMHVLSPRACVATAMLYLVLAVSCCVAFGSVCFRARVMAQDLDAINIDIPLRYAFVLTLAAYEFPISLGLFAFLAGFGLIGALRFSNCKRQFWIVFLAFLGAVLSLGRHFIMAIAVRHFPTCTLGLGGADGSYMLGGW